MRVAVLSFTHERAEHYARLLRDRPGVELLAADDDPARGREVAARLGITVSPVDDVLALQPAAVVVTSSPAGHRDLVGRAAAVGAHVLCTQPLATTEADGVAMLATCRRAGVRLAMTSPWRHSPAYEALRRVVADGGIGSVLALNGVCATAVPANWEPRTHGGGVVAGNLPGLADLVDGLLGGAPAVQTYALAPAALTAAESAALVSVTYPSTTATFDVRWGEPTGTHPPTVTVFGESADVEFVPTPRLLDGFDTALERAWSATDGRDPDAAVLDRFLAGVHDDVDAGSDGAAGLRVLRIVLAAYRSVETGQPVDLTEKEVSGT